MANNIYLNSKFIFYIYLASTILYSKEIKFILRWQKIVKCTQGVQNFKLIDYNFLTPIIGRS